MNHISYYSEDAIRSRMSVRQAIGHELTTYDRTTWYGVVTIHYRIEIKDTMKAFAALLIVPGFFYLVDKALFDGDICTTKKTHYFDASSGREISIDEANEMRSRNSEAVNMSSQGHGLNLQGRYEEAYRKFNQACISCTSGYIKMSEFITGKHNARIRWAEDLNEQGNKLLEQKKYSEAAEKYREAYETCTSYSMCTGDRKDLEKHYLSNEGNCYRMQGNYSRAVELFEKALAIDSDYDHAKNNLAETLNSWGDAFLNLRDYAGAIGKFNEAFEKCTASYINKEIFSQNAQKCQCELDAYRLERKGDKNYRKGKFESAKRKYQEAFCKSGDEFHRKGYEASINKAQDELDAQRAHLAGMELFGKGEYGMALEQFQAALTKSRVIKMKNKYGSRLSEAKSEVEARRLKSLGDKLFANWQYEAALEIYEAACKTSKNSKEKSLHAMNKEKAETIIGILSSVGDLWKAGWDIENDVEENDRSEEAKETFGRVLCKVREGLRICPDDPSLKRYERLVLWKEEGNELFNKGLEYQERGLELMRDAREHRDKRKYELAKEKLKCAKVEFFKAMEKFQIGIETDARFKDCLEFVEKQIKKVDNSIKVIEREVLNLKLIDLKMNISERRDRDDEFPELGGVGKHVTYHAQI
ncbi:uncharacterized protein [Hetaerina americana]|uniref:uncharacterized protein n=1 Tax=Hetaerina americana TaxID=62018 RepID=UPI003A7F3048